MDTSTNDSIVRSSLRLEFVCLASSWCCCLRTECVSFWSAAVAWHISHTFGSTTQDRTAILHHMPCQCRAYFTVNNTVVSLRKLTCRWWRTTPCSIDRWSPGVRYGGTRHKLRTRWWTPTTTQDGSTQGVAQSREPPMGQEQTIGWNNKKRWTCETS